MPLYEAGASIFSFFLMFETWMVHFWFPLSFPPFALHYSQTKVIMYLLLQKFNLRGHSLLQRMKVDTLYLVPYKAISVLQVSVNNYVFCISNHV